MAAALKQRSRTKWDVDINILFDIAVEKSSLDVELYHFEVQLSRYIILRDSLRITGEKVAS